jgi:hypothetical protein
MRLAIVAVVFCSLSATAHADNKWSAGLNLRADLGTHPIRAGGGIEFGRLDLALVLDPMFWTDGQLDTDLLAGFHGCERGWGGIAGWRISTIPLVDGTQLQHKLVAGVSAPLPQLGPFRVRWAFELATVVVKHGGDLPTDWISFASGRDFIDLVNFGTFVRFDYVGAL